MEGMTQQQIDEIKARADAATPGPWLVDGVAVPYSPRQRSRFREAGAGVVLGNGDEIIVGGLQDEQGGAVGILQQHDAEFIAHAREDIPTLVAEVQRLRARLEATDALERAAVAFLDDFDNRPLMRAAVTYVRMTVLAN